MDLSFAKTVLSFDHSYHDEYIQMLIDSSIEYIQSLTGKTYAAGVGFWDVAILILVQHWYQRSGIDNPMFTTKVSHSLDAMLITLSTSGDYT